MLRSIILSVLACIYIAQANSQTLTIPEGIAKTYSNGTRNTNGKPGKTYWQNRGRYNISVSMAPPENVINGVEQITYFNNSPNKLDSLNMKLIMNVHRTGFIRNPEGGIVVDDFKVNGTKVNWDNSKAINTSYMVGLPKPLNSRDSVKLDITWHYKLLAGTGIDREGKINPTTFYLAYFYPRVSVYDDYKGWDTQPHNGTLEFYNDFGDYTLNVTVPKNYIVWATGDLRNPNKVLQPEFAKRLEKSLTSDSTVHIVTTQDLASKNITAQNATNTWVFTSRNISDVALNVSDNYVWDAASVVVDDKTKRRASVQAAYADASLDFRQSVQFSRYALGWFSRNWPGVPYPYSKSTAVQGFADMEYPMMVNDSPQKDLAFAELVQDHEQAHTYFPFYMGINESYYAFMDEGWATTLEYLIAIDSKGKKAADDFYKKFRINGWTNGKHTNEIPVITPSPQVTSGAGNNAYNKPSLSYLALKDLLGDDLFKKALHTYISNWNGKHPTPWDYFNSMSAGSGKNLNWFFYNWFYTPSYIDLALENVEQKGAGYTLSVKNIGGFAAPFDIILTYEDGTTGTIHQTPAVWETNQKQASINLKNPKTITAVVLDGGIFMDADVSNNKWTK